MLQYLISVRTVVTSPANSLELNVLSLFVCLKSTDHVVNYKDLMALVQLTHRAGPSERLLVCKRVCKTHPLVHTTNYQY